MITVFARMMKIFRSVSRFYFEQPKWLTVVLLPAMLAMLGLFILKFSSAYAGWIENTLLIIWFLLAVLNAALAAYNADYFKNYRDEAIFSQTTLEHINHCIREKKRRLNDAVQASSGKGPHTLARAVRSKLKFERSVHFINKELFAAVEAYLKRSGRLGNAKIIVCMLAPDETGVCHLVGSANHSPGVSRRIPSKTYLNIYDRETLGGRLWADLDSLLYTTANTDKSSQEGRFKFLTSAEEEFLKSILCYKLINPVTGEPFALWCIEADDHNVLPDMSEIEHRRNLNHLLTIFAERLTLEYFHEYLFKEVDLYFRDILENKVN